MVQRVTCSADKISKLTNPQIDYIIEQVKSKTITSYVNEISETMANTSANDPNTDDPRETILATPQMFLSDEDDFEKMIEARIEKERQNEMSSNNSS